MKKVKTVISCSFIVFLICIMSNCAFKEWETVQQTLENSNDNLLEPDAGTSGATIPSQETTLVVSSEAATQSVGDRTENSSHDASFGVEIRNSLPRNLAAYILPELLWEMGDTPSPMDFLDLEGLKKDLSLTEEELQILAFSEPLGEELLHTAGRYEVWLTDGKMKWLAHLKVQDTLPPVITLSESLEYHVGETILYRKGVTVTDNSGESLQLEVDTYEVSPNIPGQYPVYYSATDSSHNVATVETTITILEGYDPTEEDVRELAEAVLDSILTEDMTPLQKARAIYDWCYYSIRTTVNAIKDDPIQGAYDGLCYRMGDCYTYFATSSYLLTLCGIDNLPVSRISETAKHYWCLVNVGTGWYHFDCSHQPDHYQCFMQTDAQVEAYGIEVREQKDYYRFDQEDMPQRAVEPIGEEEID